MPVSLVVLALLSLLSLPAPIENGPAQPLVPPDTSLPKISLDIQSATQELESTRSLPKQPTHILIPALGINSNVVGVGVNAAGAMDVPDGATNAVGWYKYGAVPGEQGSAVMDAHVYAAFKKLKYAQTGDRIYVVNASGETLEFKVIASNVYPLASVPMNTIFTDASGKYLNLITCEGRYSVAQGTYSHRRVVYTELVE